MFIVLSWVTEGTCGVEVVRFLLGKGGRLGERKCRDVVGKLV